MPDDDPTNGAGYDDIGRPYLWMISNAGERAVALEVELEHLAELGWVREDDLPIPPPRPGSLALLAEAVAEFPTVYAMVTAMDARALGMKLDGTIETQAFQDALDDLAVLRRGFKLPPSEFGLSIDDYVTVPMTVPVLADGWGKNTGQRSARICATTKLSGLVVGDLEGEDSGQGGCIDGFSIDGCDEAILPLQIGLCSQVTLGSVLVVNGAAGDTPEEQAIASGVRITHAQNFRWSMLVVENCAGHGVTTDLGAGGFQIGQLELGDIKGWHFRCLQTGVGAPYLKPSNIIIESGIFEHSPDSLGIVLVEAGLDVFFEHVIMAVPNNANYDTVMRIRNTNPVGRNGARVVLNDCKFSGNTAKTTAIDIGAGASVYLHNTKFVCQYLFKLENGAKVEGDAIPVSYQDWLHPDSTGTLDSTVIATERAAREVRKNAPSAFVETIQVEGQTMLATLTTNAGVTSWTWTSGQVCDPVANFHGKVLGWTIASGDTDDDEEEDVDTRTAVVNTTFATIASDGKSGTLTAASTVPNGTAVRLRFNEAGARARRLANGGILFGSGGDFLFGLGRIDPTIRCSMQAFAVAAGSKPNFGGVLGVFTFGAPTGEPATPVDGGVGANSRELAHLWADPASGQAMWKDKWGRKHRVSAPRVTNPRTGNLMSGRHISGTATGTPVSGFGITYPIEVGGDGLTVTDLRVWQVAAGVNAGGSTMTATLAWFRANSAGDGPDFAAGPVFTGTFDPSVTAPALPSIRSVSAGAGGLLLSAGKYFPFWLLVVTGAPSTSPTFTCISSASGELGMTGTVAAPAAPSPARALVATALTALPSSNSVTLTPMASGNYPVMEISAQ